MGVIGGTLKFGEISDNTLIREFYEELDIKVDINAPVHTLTSVVSIAAILWKVFYKIKKQSSSK
ncbi:hypothetical protein CN601_10340 [Bacillus sp. AFS017336]|nr:hypothetical protein CN601_10340 [Bacillus sp. AFS017336]